MGRRETTIFSLSSSWVLTQPQVIHELLSLFLYMAKWHQNLFVLNERVALFDRRPIQGHQLWLCKHHSENAEQTQLC